MKSIFLIIEVYVVCYTFFKSIIDIIEYLIRFIKYWRKRISSKKEES